MYLFILGRQPEIGSAELAAVFGAENIRAISRNIALISADSSEISRESPRLGSVVKIAEVFAKIPDSADLKLENFSDEIAKKFDFESGKLTLGLSSETRDLDGKNLSEISRKIREKHEKNGGSFREIARDFGAEKLNSASVLHNKLAGSSERKSEIIFAKSGGRESEFFIAKTIYVQNITSYTFRDRARPKRDAKVGMLPPKLAQTIINLAVENRIRENEESSKILLDPFVGTGVVLQEAALMGMRVYGSDIEPRMIDFTCENLEWVSRKFGREFREINAERDFERKLEVASATEAKWDFDGNFPDFVAGETYLGRAYATEPSAENLRENVGNVNKILTEFLKNLRKQASEKTGICLAVPAWFITRNGRAKTVHLPLLKELENLGFSRKNEGLIYHREDQIVGRELLILTKISRKK